MHSSLQHYGYVFFLLCLGIVFAFSPFVTHSYDVGDPDADPDLRSQTTVSKFVPLVAIPGFTDTTEQRSLADYLNIIFRVAIGLGALAAVIRITFAGIKYMSTDRFYSKEEAKKDITSSLFGLLIILSTVLVLAVIYPGILNLNILQKLTPLKTMPYQPSGVIVDIDQSVLDQGRQIADVRNDCSDGSVVKKIPSASGEVVVECVSKDTAGVEVSAGTVLALASQGISVDQITDSLIYFTLQDELGALNISNTERARRTQEAVAEFEGSCSSPKTVADTNEGLFCIQPKSAANPSTTTPVNNGNPVRAGTFNTYVPADGRPAPPFSDFEASCLQNVGAEASQTIEQINGKETIVYTCI